jgi:hypothetical protein
MFQTKFVEKIKTHILCSITFFFRKSWLLWDNVEKYGTARQATDDNIIWRMRFACCITKATDTHSQYVILIALPRQQFLSERASILPLYVHCLSCFYFIITAMSRATTIKHIWSGLKPTYRIKTATETLPALSLVLIQRAFSLFQKYTNKYTNH